MDKQVALQKIKDECQKDASLILDQTFPQLVFGKGNPNAKILFIGEAPGKNEALQGMPFVGTAGKKLNALLAIIDLTLDDCYIANILKYRPSNNHAPTTEEMLRHTPYLVQQIKAIQPKIIMTLGNYATKFVLAGFSVEGMDAIAGITQLHGTVQNVSIKNKTFKVIPLFHPAAMIYNQKLKPIIEEDFRKAKELLNKN
jgi:uracil-DNA glycosylase